MSLSPLNSVAHPADVEPFVPSFLRQRFDTSRGAAADSEASSGAVLFADISGFTALSERLATHGPDGVEELTMVLNDYFGKLIELISDHGGDVIKFAGDAMLAYWPVEATGSLERATHSAARCGLAVQNALQTFGSRIGHRLFLRVGVGAGELLILSLGGVRDRWEYVLVGPPVLEATLSAGKGEPGSVILGRRAAERLGSAGETAEVEPGFTRLLHIESPHPVVSLRHSSLQSESVSTSLSYIPAAIHRRLEARQTGWLAEMRRLTILFVNLPELTENTPLDRAQEILEALQTELYHVEGSLNKLSIDEKGVTLVAALGLPPLAHEDDPRRGLLAGLGMQAALTRLGTRGSVGITSGRVFCGTIGNRLRCEYTMIGDVVNLSARLMQAAKGRILCDESTYHSARSKLTWETLSPITVKGKSQPIPVFRPLGEIQFQTPLESTREIVGRAAERERLEPILLTLVQKKLGAVVLLEGEAGIGKSTVVASLVQRATELGIATWIGTALAMERSTPYFIWRPIFRKLFQIDSPSLSAEEQRRRVLNQLSFDPDLIPLAPLLDVVLALDFPVTPAVADMFGEARLNSVNALLIRLLIRLTERTPLQLILEDGHWLDSSSWTLARRVSQQVPALILVVVTRPLTDPLPREYLPMLAAPTTRKLTVGPFSPEESLSLVRRRLDIDEVPEPMADLLQAKAQGNPFFLEEMAYALRDSGKIQIRDRQCNIAPGVDLTTSPFPDNVQGVITSRIDRLAPPEQLALKVASVIGRTFTQSLMLDVGPIEEDRPHLPNHLAALVRQSLTVLEVPEPDPTFSFKHMITQEVSYQMMPPGQRKALHRSVAEWYELHHGSDLSSYYPLLAKHWSNTDQVGRALHYLEKSGENAMRDFAHVEAVFFFTQAIALDEQEAAASDAFRRGCWHRQLAEAYYHLSDNARSRDHFEIALDLLGFPVKRSASGTLISTFWEIGKQVLHRLFPRRFIGRLKESDVAHRLEAARAYERITQIYYSNNEKVSTIHGALRALNLSETGGETPELARNYAHAIVISGLLRFHRAAREYARRARAVAEAVDQKSCLGYVEYIRTIYWVTVGEWEEAESNIIKAIEYSEQTGERRRWYENTISLAVLLCRKAEYRQGLPIAIRVYEYVARRNVPQVLLWSVSWYMLGLHVLDPENAELIVLEKALERCLKANLRLLLADQILGWGVLALSRWRQGDEPAAREAFENASRIMKHSNQISHYLLTADSGLAEVYAGIWKRHTEDANAVREMHSCLEHLIEIMREFTTMYPIGQADLWLMRGDFDWLRGRKRSAMKAWRKALLAAERFRMPYEAAKAHATIGLHSEIDDPSRSTHLGEAKAIFTRVGAVFDLRAIEAQPVLGERRGVSPPVQDAKPADERQDRKGITPN